MPAPLVLPAPSPPAPTTTQGSTFTWLPAGMGMDKTARIATSPGAATWERPETVEEEATTPLRVRVQRVPHLPTVVGRTPPADPRRDLNPDGETWTWTTTWSLARMPAHPAAEDPRMVHHLDLQVEDDPEDRWHETARQTPVRRAARQETPGGPPGGDSHPRTARSGHP